MASLEIFLWTDGDDATYQTGELRGSDGRLKSRDQLTEETGRRLADNTPIPINGPDVTVLVPATAIRSVVVRD